MGSPLRLNFVIAGLVCGVSSALVYAELSAIPGTPIDPPGKNKPSGPSPSAPANRGIPIFDDSVFELSADKKEEPPKSGRKLGTEPDYTTDQREEFIQLCEDKKKENMSAFRNCVEEKKNNARAKLKLRMDGGAGTVAEPRNAPPLMDEGSNREPAFRGVDIEKIEEK